MFEDNDDDVSQMFCFGIFHRVLHGRFSPGDRVSLVQSSRSKGFAVLLHTSSECAYVRIRLVLRYSQSQNPDVSSGSTTLAVLVWYPSGTPVLVSGRKGRGTRAEAYTVESVLPPETSPRQEGLPKSDEVSTSVSALCTGKKSIHSLFEQRSFPSQTPLRTNRILIQKKHMTTAASLPSAEQDREAQGKCLSCGRQLFQLVQSTSPDHIGGLERIPLTIPHEVERGQCLRCCPVQPDNNNTATGTAANALYKGEFNSRGQKHGHGEMTWSNGDVYKGEFSNDQRHGHGTLTFAQGGEYVGNWTHNQMHGSGTRRYPNGDVYMGTYVQGNRQGTGRFYYANGDLYDGSFVQNRLHGPGRYYYAAGQRFEGDFRHGKRYGKGKLQRTDGSLDIFQYVNDERVGQGVRWSQDRTKAWRLWMPTGSHQNNGTGTHSILEKQKISVADAVSLVYQIDQAVAELSEETNESGMMS